MCAPNFFFFFFLVRNSLFIVYNLFILMQHSILPNSLVEFWTGIDKCFCIEYTVEWKTKSEKNWKKCIKFRCSLHWKKLTISASHVSRKAHTHTHTEHNLRQSFWLKGTWSSMLKIDVAVHIDTTIVFLNEMKLVQLRAKKRQREREMEKEKERLLSFRWKTISYY